LFTCSNDEVDVDVHATGVSRCGWLPTKFFSNKSMIDSAAGCAGVPTPVVATGCGGGGTGDGASLGGAALSATLTESARAACVTSFSKVT
jgi:hypothetical protein